MGFNPCGLCFVEFPRELAFQFLGKSSSEWVILVRTEHFGDTNAVFLSKINAVLPAVGCAKSNLFWRHGDIGHMLGRS